METKDMKTTVTLILLLALGSLPALSGEPPGQVSELNVEGRLDHEGRLVKDGVLGTVNVLRDLDVKTWANRVRATSNVDDKAGNTVTFGALWDDTYLYVGVKVLDGNLQKTSEAGYMNDSVEVYVDPTHNKATTYGSQDRQFVKGWNDEAIHGTNTTGVLHGWATITGGYTVELAIPWSNLGVTPSPKMTIGFDVGNNNSDGPCGRNTQLMWHGTDQNWQDTSAFGDLVLSAQTTGEGSGAASRDAGAPVDRSASPPPATAVTAKKTLSKLIIDGKLDESVWSLPMKAGKLLSGTGNANDTIDGSGKSLQPRQDGSAPLVLTYALPALRTVSSLVIAYQDGSDAPDTVRLEGSADGGKTWSELLNRKARKTAFLGCFKPAKANVLRLTQEGGGLHRTKEVFVYADPEALPPLFGGADSGAFSFLRDLWYAGKIKLFSSPTNAVWTSPGGGKSFVLFQSNIVNTHDGALGAGVPYGRAQPDKRLYLRFDLDKAYPMNYGLISADHGEGFIARESRAEFYTANGNLDPGKLKGSSIKDLTGQGWILQKAWDKDPNLCKSFLLERPGQYSQMLLVWDCVPGSSAFSHLEMFGSQARAVGGDPGIPGGGSAKPAAPQEKRE